MCSCTDPINFGHLHLAIPDDGLIDDDEDEVLSHAQRGGFEREAREFADAQGYSVDWDSVEKLDSQDDVAQRMFKSRRICTYPFRREVTAY